MEIWNEPPWQNDRWDGGVGCFYANPGPQATCQTPNFGLAKALLATTPPASVRWSWGGTHKSGSKTLMATGCGLGVTPTSSQILQAMSSEGFHLYGATPEWHLYLPSCLRQHSASAVVSACALPGADPVSNFKVAAKLAMERQVASGWTILQHASEIGIETTNLVTQRRFVLRSLLGYHGAMLERVNFYRLSDRAGTSGGFAFMSAEGTLTPAAQALAALMQDLDSMPGAPAAYSSVDLPAVTAYSGSWPLMAVPIIGRRSGTSSNRIILVLWQRSYAGSQAAWEGLARPAGGSATVSIPADLRVVRAWSLATRQAVAVTTKSATAIVVPVPDDPIVVQFDR